MNSIGKEKKRKTINAYLIKNSKGERVRGGSRETDRQTDRETERQTDRQTDRQRRRERETERQRDRQRERERENTKKKKKTAFESAALCNLNAMWGNIL